MRIALLVSAAFILAACASGPDIGLDYTYDELRIINNSQALIRNLTVTVADTGAVYKCGDIVALGICSERFGRRKYTEAPFSVDWAFGNNARQTDEIEIEVPAYNSPGNPLYAVFEISPQGIVSAYFVQKIPP